MIRTDENSISYIHSGLFVTDSVWIHPKRIETTYEIICVTSGIVHIEEGGIQYELSKGDVIILKPGIMHQGHRESFGKTSFYWLHFWTDNFSAFKASDTPVRNFTDIAMFKQILHIANTPDYQPQCVEALLLVLIYEIVRLSKHNNSDESKIIYEAAEWIRINSIKKITVSLVASLYGYNGEHFSRMFKRMFSIGLKEYICRERMKVSCDILCNTSYSVKQIAAMLNFDDENQFVHFFKYHQSESPARYRNKHYNIRMNKD